MSLTLPWSGSRPLAADQPDFLSDVFAPVPSETETTALRVEGRLPEALSGVYARIGPNPLKARPKRYHWFIGDGMVHGLRLQGGQAEWYRSRYVGSNTAHKALGRPILPGPRNGVGDVVNTNVYAHGGRVWASVEAGMLPVQLDARLESVRHGTFDSPRTSSLSLPTRTAIRTPARCTPSATTPWFATRCSTCGCRRRGRSTASSTSRCSTAR